MVLCTYSQGTCALIGKCKRSDTMIICPSKICKSYNFYTNCRETKLYHFIMSNPVFYRIRLRVLLERRIRFTWTVRYESSSSSSDPDLGSEILIPTLLLKAGLEVNKVTMLSNLTHALYNFWQYRLFYFEISRI